MHLISGPAQMGVYVIIELYTQTVHWLLWCGSANCEFSVQIDGGRLGHSLLIRGAVVGNVVIIWRHQTRQQVPYNNPCKYVTILRPGSRSKESRNVWVVNRKWRGFFVTLRLIVRENDPYKCWVRTRSAFMDHTHAKRSKKVTDVKLEQAAMTVPNALNAVLL